MIYEESGELWRGVLRGVIVIGSLALAGFHFLLHSIGSWRQHAPTWFDYTLDFWFEYYGYCILANVLLLFPWLQPWTGYGALLVAAMALPFGLYGLFPEGVGLPYIVYAIIVVFVFWQIVGFKRPVRQPRRTGFPLD